MSTYLENAIETWNLTFNRVVESFLSVESYDSVSNVHSVTLFFSLDFIAQKTLKFVKISSSMNRQSREITRMFISAA